jgi:EpsI family protein
MKSGVEEMLDADFHVQRSYVHRTGFLLWLYVGYYGTERGGRPEHTPWVCYPSNGWEIVSREVVKVDANRRANEIIVEKGGKRRLVHFWFQTYREKQVIGGIDQLYERLAGRILEGRADGSLVRLSTPLPESLDVDFVRSRLIAFGRDVAPLLHEHWPEEFVDPTS